MAHHRSQRGPNHAHVATVSDPRTARLSGEVRAALPGLTKTSRRGVKGPHHRTRAVPEADFDDTCLPAEGYHGAECSCRG